MSFFIIIIFLLFSEDKVFADSPNQCTSGFRSSETLMDWAIQTKTTLDTHPHQQLYPSINFTCKGVLTKWIMKARSELVHLNFNNNVYPELQIWRPGRGDNPLYRKVGNSTIDVRPQHQLTHIYSVRPDPPLSFQNGDIFGIWEGTNNYANTREVDNIRPVSGTRHIDTEGFNYEALSPQTYYAGGDQLRNLGVPLVVVETDPPRCNTFINLETLATHATRVSCCNSSYYLHIIPQMTFTCAGNITGWTVGASWVNTNDAKIVPELQIWRSEVSAGSIYSRVASVPLTPTPPENTNVNGGYIKKRLFSNSFEPPINVRRGDLLGLVLPSSGQLLIQMVSFPDISLPMNYIFESASNFSYVKNVDLQSSSWTSVEYLQPLISLEISADNSIVETTHVEPQTTTPTIATPLSTSTESLSTSANEEYTSTQPQSTTTAMEEETHMTTEDLSALLLLESKHIFGIIVAVIMLVVLLLVLSLSALGLSLFVKSRRQRRRNNHFVETFIQTGDNEAYQSRTTLLTRSNHDQRDRNRDLAPNSHSNSIATTSNVAHKTGSRPSGHSEVINPTPSNADPNTGLEFSPKLYSSYMYKQHGI